MSRATRWKLTGDAGGEAPALDEYFKRFLSGVQPVRDEAVVAFDEDSLRDRMLAYYDSEVAWGTLVEQHPGFGVARAGYNPLATRQRLLDGSSFLPDRLVRFLY